MFQYEPSLIRLLTRHAPLVLGKLGSWVPWLLTLGRWSPDEESWTALIIGWFVLVAIIVAGSLWGASLFDGVVAPVR